MPLRLTVDAKPGKTIASIAVRDGIVLVAVRERAVDGRANAAIERAVAAWLGVSPRSVSIVSGAASRRKVIEVAGIDAATLATRLAALEAHGR